jgi:hypothetical protein
MPQPPVHHLDQALAYIFNPLVLRHDLRALHEQSQLLADFRRSGSASGLVKSNANDWSSRMQMGGQVHAITQKASNLRLAGIFIY